MNSLVAILSKIGSFTRNINGNFAVVSAIVAPVLMGGVTVAIDYSTLSNKRSLLQQIADAAALSSAQELKLSGTTRSHVEEAARQSVYANLVASGDSSLVNSGTLSINTRLSDDDYSVTVDIREVWTPFFAHLIESGVTPIRVSATALVAGEDPICIVGLMDAGILASMHIDNNAVLDAGQCGIYSNSPSRFGIRADKNASLSAKSICSAGGYWKRGGTAVMEPLPTTDCPQIPDPLGDRPAPKVGSCKESNLVITTDKVLDPGTYCGGLKVLGDVSVRFNPGIYAIKDGPLMIGKGAAIEGKGTGFFLTGKASTFYFAPNSKIDLSAPESGALAGILIYEDRDVAHDFRFDPLRPQYLFNSEGYDNPSDNVRAHRISSNDARRLIGTIYLPASVLLIDSNAQVADQSAYTAIVVARLWLRDGPRLVLNTDYAATQVPVPGSLGGGAVRLAR